MTLVLFLDRQEGKLVFMGMPFARVSEDVPAEDALWVKAALLYAQVAALPEAARRPELEARREALQRAGDADSLALAADIDRQLTAERQPAAD